MIAFRAAGWLQHQGGVDARRRRAAEQSCRRNGLRSRLAVAGVAAAAAAAVVASFVVIGSARTGETHHRNSAFPRLESVVAAQSLPAGVTLRSARLEPLAAPQLVIGNILWSVQNVGAESSSYVLRSDVRLHVLSTTHFSNTYNHSQTTQLARTGGIVVLPMQSYQPPGQSGSRDAILRFDASTGRMLSPLFVRFTGIDVVTPQGVFVQTDTSTLGLLDATGSRILRQITMPFADAVVYSGGRLWGYDVSTSRIVGVDPANGRVVSSVPMPGTINFNSPLLIPADPGAVLVLLSKGAGPGAPTAGTYRLDTGSLRLTAGTSYGSDGDVGARSWAVDGDRLWSASGGLLVELDAKTMQMVRAYSVAGSLNDTGINAIIPIDGNRLFVSDSSSSTLWSLDLTRLR